MLAKSAKWVLGAIVGGVLGNTAYDNAKTLWADKAPVVAKPARGHYVLDSYNPGYYVVESYNPGYYETYKPTNHGK